MMLRELLTAPDLAAYSVVMIDEAHERTLSTDVLFGLLKDIARSQAGPQAARLLGHAGRGQVQPVLRLALPSSSSQAAASPWTSTTPRRLRPTTWTRPWPPCCRSTPRSRRGDILVFLTGQEEIESMQETLAARAKLLPRDSLELLVLPIYSALPSEQQAKIFTLRLPPAAARSCWPPTSQRRR